MARKQHNLFSKGDVANLMGVTSQTFANWQSRDSKFPEPTYSNKAGNVTLYSPEDIQRIFDYTTKAQKEEIARREANLKAVLSGEAQIEQLEGQSTIDDADAEFDAAAPAKAEEAPKPVAEPKSAPVSLTPEKGKEDAPKADAKAEPVKEAPKAEEAKPEAKADDKDKALVGAGAPASDAKAEDKPKTTTAPKARGSVLNKR